MKTARKSTQRRAVARRPRPLSLSMRVERLEKELLFARTPAKAEKARAVESPRFVNLDANGKPTAGDHVAIYQAETGLIWTAAPLKDGANLTHPEALQAAKDLRLLGHDDWRAPSIRELLSIVDYERYDPAVDPTHFKGPYGWAWSGTVAKYPAGCAWYVHLFDGFSSRGHQGIPFHALAVRAGQPLSLGL